MFRPLVVLFALFLSCSPDRSLPVGPAGKAITSLDSSSDREALQSFYDHLKRGMNQSSIHALEWNHWTSRSTLAKWKGLTLDEEGRVVELHLDGGTINTKWIKIPKEAFAALAELDQLKVLDIRNLYLMIDPSDLGKLRNLEYLDLYYNFFIEGASYTSVCQLNKLTFLSNIVADDSLLECIGSMSQLEHLKIKSNYFEFRGEWTSEWTRTDVCESCSRFSKGSFVDSLSPAPDSLLLSNLKELQNLKRLELRDMGLRTIPPWVGDLQSLESLSFGGIKPFGGNPLVGPIPPEMTNLRNLKSLSLVASGTLPAEIGQMESLERISIAGPYTYNKDGATGFYYGKFTEEEIAALPGLEGTLPSEWENLSNLKYLYLRGYISGDLPSEWGSLDKLEVLWMEDMELTGPIPVEWGGMTSIQELYLYNNLISGPIPPEIGNLLNLSILSLHTNSISGSIPQELGDLPELWALNLRDNQLTGSIPRFSQARNLKYLDLSNNQLSGEITSPFPYLPSIISLRLQENDFTGSFPDMSRLATLRFLKIFEGNNIEYDGQLPCRLLPPKLNYHDTKNYEGNFQSCAN